MNVLRFLFLILFDVQFRKQLICQGLGFTVVVEYIDDLKADIGLRCLRFGMGHC